MMFMTEFEKDGYGERKGRERGGKKVGRRADGGEFWVGLAGNSPRKEAPQEDPGRLPLSLGNPHQLHLGLHDPHTDPTAIVPPTKSPSQHEDLARALPLEVVGTKLPLPTHLSDCSVNARVGVSSGRRAARSPVSPARC